MVGFHVIDHQIVDFAVGDDFADVGFETACECLLDRIDQRHFLAHDEIGVVRDALRQRPERFETGRRAVVDTDIIDAGMDFGNHYRNLFIDFTSFVQKYGLAYPVSEKSPDRNRDFLCSVGPEGHDPTTFGL